MQSPISHQRLPWSGVRSESALFRASLAVMFALLFLCALVVSVYVVPEPDREELEELPPQLARLIKEKPAKKPIPVPVKKPEVVEKPPEVKKEKIVKPAPKPAPPKPKPKKSIKQVEKKLTETKKSTAKQVQQAREVAKKSGLFAMQSDLQALSSTVSSSKFAGAPTANTTAKGAKTVSAISEQALAATSSAQAASEQGAAVSDASLNAADTTKVDATEDELKLAAAERAQNNARKDEDLNIVVEGLRSTFNLLYNRALRNDPFLEGRLVLRIVIEPNGSVSSVEVIENELSDEALVKKLIARMKLTNFGPSNAEPLLKTLPFEFRPS